jgi:hypothetical protein
VVPAEVFAAWVELLVNRQPHRLAIKVPEQIAGRAPCQGSCYPQPQVLAHRDCPVVEQAMMQRTERQAVRHLVRSAVGMPADVCGVDPIRSSTKCSEATLINLATRLDVNTYRGRAWW